MQGPTILLDQKDQTLMTDKTKADGDTGHTVASDPDGTMGESIDISSQKHFSFWSTMGINFGAFLPPLAIGSYLALSIGAGGSAGYIYGFLCAFIFQLFVCASAAEMSAVFPHTGGQIFWSAQLSSPSQARFFSYLTAVFTTGCWIFWLSLTFLFGSQGLFALITFLVPEFSVQTYQIYFVFLAGAVVALIANTVLFKQFNIVLRLMLGLVCSTTTVIFVGLLVRAKPKQSARVALTEFVNETGWSSDVLVFFLSLLPGITTMNGFDSAAHMADEVPNPSVQIPKVMMATALLSGLTAFPMTFVYVFCTVDPAALLTPVGGQPIIQLYLDSFNNRGLTIAVVAIGQVLVLIGGASTTTACSRVVWSLARDRCWPYSYYLSRTHGKEELPSAAICVSLLLSCLVGLLVFGSQAALGALASAGAICNFISMGIPLTLSIINGRKHFRTPHYFNLGRFGLLINVVALSWMSLMTVFLSMPLYYPTTASSMNYSCAFIGGLIIFGLLNWMVVARKNYKVPHAMPTVNWRSE